MTGTWMWWNCLAYRLTRALLCGLMSSSWIWPVCGWTDLWMLTSGIYTAYPCGLMVGLAAWRNSFICSLPNSPGLFGMNLTLQLLYHLGLTGLEAACIDPVPLVPPFPSAQACACGSFPSGFFTPRRWGAVSVWSHLSLWSAGGTLGLDVPVRNTPTGQISQAWWMMHVGRNLPEGPYFFAIFPATSNIKKYIKQYQAIYQAMQFNAVPREFEEAIIAQKSFALFLDPVGCLEAIDRQHVRLQQGECCERRWGPIVPNEAVPVKEDGSSSGSCYLD